MVISIHTSDNDRRVARDRTTSMAQALPHRPRPVVILTG